METDYWRTVFLWRTKVHGGITRETLRWAEVHPHRNVKREERSSFRHAKVWGRSTASQRVARKTLSRLRPVVFLLGQRSRRIPPNRFRPGDPRGGKAQRSLYRGGRVPQPLARGFSDQKYVTNKFLRNDLTWWAWTPAPNSPNR